LDRIVVLDASALMAVIRGEKGAEKVAASLSQAIVSTVNLAEVETKLVSAGLDERLAWWHITELRCASVPFDEEQAKMAGGLVKITKPFGLSLGDRACLALAIQRKATVYTTDQTWKNLALEIPIEVIR
jgi:PIN domain nuclease of toxin-antitoxin system